MIRKMALLGTISLLTFGLCFGQDSLTVDQAVRLVLEHHPAIAQAAQNVLASEARAMQSTSSSYPTVNAEGSYAFLAPIAKLAFPGLGEFKLYPADNYNAHIEGRYTLYDFGKRDATADVSKSRVMSSRDAVDLTKNALAFQTIRVFYSILFLERSILVQDEQIEALNQHLLTTQRRVSAGTATSFDVLTTQVRVAAAQNQKLDQINILQKQSALLAQLLGESSVKAIRIRGEFEHVSVPTNSDSLLQSAVRQRMEIKMAQDGERSAELQQKLTTLGNKPSLNVSLIYGFKNGYIPNLDVLRGNAVAAVTAEVPIFDGGHNDHQREEAQANVLAEQAHQRDIQQQVRSDVQQAVADVEAAASKIPISELQLHHAKEAVSMAQQRYETGTVTNLDLLDAQAAESSAKLASLQALYRLVMSKYELRRAIGAQPLN
jgi:outer membrane protein